VPEPTLVLKAGRSKALRRCHPWVFSGAVARVTGDPAPGDTVAVYDDTGGALGRAAYSPSSQIAARMWTFDPSERVDDDWIAHRVMASAARREHLAIRTDAARLVFAESDGLPGVILDRYGDVAVLELTSAGADRWRPVLAAAAAALPGVVSVIERSDVDVRTKEGLQPRTGLLSGEEPAEAVEVHEDGRRFGVDVRLGHKTGFYLDQRDNRALVAGLARGRRVLDVCSYTGGFGVAAYDGGAVDVVSIDSSAAALGAAASNRRRNGQPVTGLVRADAFDHLRALRREGASADLIVLDPPKLAASESQVARAARAYKDLNLQAFHLLAPGGLLVTFSCSGAVGEDLFQKIVAGAALDARRDAQVVGRLSQAEDHPVLLSFPESAYLKGLVCRVI
jgi:23S rRNA (cytosine1962-C5)-methyltransferase